MNQKRSLLIHASVLGALGVSIGALGAHGLKPHLSANAIDSFETGVRYQLYHALFLLLLSVVANEQSRFFSRLKWVVTIGVVCFSGSIYLLVTDGLMGVSLPKLFGLVTPIGGVLLIISWIGLLIWAIKQKSKVKP